MAERVTDVRDVRDRIVAELTGQGEPGVPNPDAPVGAARRRPGPGRHRRAGPDPGDRPGHPARRHDQPHRDHRPAAGPALRGRPSAGWTTSRPGATVLLDGEQGTVTVDPDPAEAQARVEAARAAAEALAGLRGPGHDPRRARRAGAGQRAGRRRGAGRRGRARRGRRAAAHRAGLPRARRGALRRGAGRRATRRSSRPSPAARSCCARWTPARTSRWPSRPCPTRPTRRWACAGCGSPAGTRASSTRQLDAVAAGRRGRPAATPWVMAPMVATVAEAADFAALVRERGHGARRDDRGALGGAAGRPAAASTSTSCPSAPTTCPSTRWPPTGSPADLADLTDPWQPALLRMVAADRRGRPAHRQAGRGLRRGRRRPAAGLRAGRARASPRCPAPPPRWPASARSSARSTLATCQQAAEVALAADDPQAARAAVREVLDARLTHSPPRRQRNLCTPSVAAARGAGPLPSWGLAATARRPGAGWTGPSAVGGAGHRQRVALGHHS